MTDVKESALDPNESVASPVAHAPVDGPNIAKASREECATDKASSPSSFPQNAA